MSDITTNNIIAVERRRILIARKAAAKAQRERSDVLAVRRIEAIGSANPPVEPATVSVNEFVVLSGVSHPTIYRWIKAGTIKSVMIGGRRLIPYSEALPPAAESTAHYTRVAAAPLPRRTVHHTREAALHRVATIEDTERMAWFGEPFVADAASVHGEPQDGLASTGRSAGAPEASTPPAATPAPPKPRPVETRIRTGFVERRPKAARRGDMTDNERNDHHG
jgi:excisionase family DNA binding protein